MKKLPLLEQGPLLPEEALFLVESKAHFQERASSFPKDTCSIIRKPQVRGEQQNPFPGWRHFHWDKSQFDGPLLQEGPSSWRIPTDRPTLDTRGVDTRGIDTRDAKTRDVVTRGVDFLGMDTRGVHSRAPQKYKLSRKIQFSYSSIFS